MDLVYNLQQVGRGRDSLRRGNIAWDGRRAADLDPEHPQWRQPKAQHF